MILSVLGSVALGVVAVFLVTALTGAPYVPTRRHEVEEAFTVLRPLNADDVVVDIGSGDGVVLAAVARRGAKAIGYEINPLLVGMSQWRLRKYRDTASVRLRNFWLTPFPTHTSVVYTFGDSRDIAKMYTKVQREATRLNRSIDLISYAFEVPGVQATRTHRAYFLYTVAALHQGKP